MSLLLDALKKAADDKKKISQGEAVDRLSLDKNVLAPTELDEISSDDKDIEELTLETLEPKAADVISDSSTPIEHSQQEVEKPESAKAASAKATSYTVSDEALSMLIDKTNRDVKQGKRRIFISVVLVSLFILTVGGFYYYTNMQAEIAVLERKHKISMQAMKSKTNNGNFPKESKIIHNLVGESVLSDKVEYAKKQIANNKNTQQNKLRQMPLAKNNKPRIKSPAVTFQKTKKIDVAAENIGQAWLAYNNAQYGKAEKLYANVLVVEKNNRDALLGLGAIAVVEKNNAKAKEIYSRLLESDPRNSVAIAALTSLKNSKKPNEVDENYLLNMLQKNPNDAHLNFALGNVYAQQSKWKLAQQAYFNAWQADAENADYLFNLAISMDQLGKQQKALEFYRSSLVKSENKNVNFSRDAVQKRINELAAL